MERLTRVQVERMIDISAVQAPNGLEEVRRIAEYARDKKFCAVHVLPNWVPTLKELMSGNQDTLVGSSVGFPSGGHTTEIKVLEARQLMKAGVQEMDMMINVGRLKSGHYDYVEKEIRALKEVAGDLTLKVILEAHYLSSDEVKKACELCINAGADYVKTGSGWAAGGTSLELISLMVDFVAGRIKVKASGGVRNLETVEKMHRLGVSRFGINMEAVKRILQEAKA